MTPGDVANRLQGVGPVDLPGIDVALRLAEMVFTGDPGTVEERVELIDAIEPALASLKEHGEMAVEVAERCLKLRAVPAKAATWF